MLTRINFKIFNQMIKPSDHNLVTTKKFRRIFLTGIQSNDLIKLFNLMINLVRITTIVGIALLLWQCSGEQSANVGQASQPAQTVSESSTGKRIPQYQTLTAKPEDKARSLNITGRTQALERLQIESEVQGKALSTSKLLNEGIRYRKGETLVKIEDAQFRLDLRSQKSQFQSSLVRIMSQLKLDYPEAYPDWADYLKSLDPGEILAPLPEVADGQLRYFLSANNIFSAYYAIKSAEELLPKYEIEAPFTGVITKGNVTPGSVINPGVPLATLSRTDVFELKAAISSADMERLKRGQKIELTHSNTGESWTGIVHRLGGAFDPGTQSVPVFIRVSGRGLRENMFLEAELEAENYDQVVTLPLSALTRKNQVHHIQDSTIMLKDVEPVQFEKDRVWVKGLTGGEQIIVDDIRQPIVGAKALPKS